MSGRIRVQVVLALPDGHDLSELQLDAGSTLAQAVTAGGALVRHPGLGLGVDTAGIFGVRAPADRVLRDGDRVELYRALQADPKAARRARAARKARRT